MKDKKKQLLLSVLGILSLVLITVGVTYAIFTYTRLGTTDNTVTTGTLKFLYTENSKGGTGISITDAFPITDTEGKILTGDNKVFDFKVEGTNTGKDAIPYEVTLRKKSTSTLAESNIKVYLTDMSENADTEILAPTLYSNLTQTNVDVGDEVEKTLFTGSVLGNTANYLKEFRLRMWIDEASNQDEINGKTFKTTVNVYSNVPLISEEEIASRNSTEVSSLTINGLEATKVTGQDYDYKIKVAEGTSSITINAETTNTNATIVSIEKIDSLAYSDTATIKRLSTSKTFDLTEGDNYFKITVRSENGATTKEYKLKVEVVSQNTVNLTGFAKKIYDANPLIEAEPTLTDSSNNTSDASGLYKSTATNSGNPTYYFRGNVENNYVSFAGQTWRVVRINEDGTIRMIMANGIDNDTRYAFNSSYNNYSYMYYTNSEAKTTLETWYTTNIASNPNYASKVATGDYFCEQAKVKSSSSYSAENATMEVYSSYTPNFKCEEDGNGKGIVNSSIGLINYDEIVFAGGYYGKDNSSYYLNNNTSYWTMNPGGVRIGIGVAFAWLVDSTGDSTGRVLGSNVNNTSRLRAVLNLNADVAVTGSGTSTDPWTVV